MAINDIKPDQVFRHGNNVLKCGIVGFDFLTSINITRKWGRAILQKHAAYIVSADDNYEGGGTGFLRNVTKLHGVTSQNIVNLISGLLVRHRRCETLSNNKHYI